MTVWFKTLCLVVVLAFSPTTTSAAVPLHFTVNLSEVVNVDTTGGTPRIAVDVGGVTRYATYTAGTGTSALTFTYDAVIGDVDLDGVALSSPIDLNGGTIKDAAGNDATLTFTPPNTSGVKVNYPSLGMDFVADADGRYTLNGTVYNNLTSFLTATGGTFSRASIGTYFDSTGTLQTASSGTPRFDYDPVTLAPKGILIEESRTNSLLRSSEFDNAVWGKSNTTISSNVIVAPDGSLTVDKLIESSTSALHRASSNSTVISGAQYTISIYVKAAERSHLAVLHNNEPNGYTTFNLLTGAAVNAPAATSTIIPLSDGWYRCTVTATMTGTGRGFEIWLINNTGWNSNYLGDGTSGIYIWGAQLEQGAFATSYIPTTTAAVTRQRDALVIPKATWFDESRGTAIASSFHANGGNYRRMIGLSPSNKAILSTGGDRSTIQTWSGVSGQILDAPISPGPLSESQSGRFGLAWDSFSGTRSLTANGLSPVNQSSYPGDYTTTSVTFGCGSGGDCLSSTLRSAKYYPLRVSDSQLQLLTQ